MTITLGETQFTDVGKLMDTHGVRVHHRRVLQGMLTIMSMREGCKFPLCPADFNVFLRCVGAGVDFRAAPVVFGSMADHGLIPQRTSQTWIEFLKARYMVEPTYYQHDRTRVAVDPRDLVTHDDVVDAGKVEAVHRMDQVRFSRNAFLREPWNRRRDEPEEDIRRQLRRHGDGVQESSDYRSFWRHFIRQQVYPNEVSEELLCTSMVGFSRSGDKDAVLNLVLKDYYGIEVDEGAHAVTGGLDFAEGSPVYPTSRLLYSLVETFGAMSEVSLGMLLVDFVSQRYNVPIPPAVWSNLLNWSYVSASKRNQHLRKILDDDQNTHVNKWDVLHVWQIMTSEPYNVTPSFQDLDILVRTLLLVRHMDTAIELIRQSAMPYYDKLVEDFEDALVDEILLKDTTANSAPSESVNTTISRAIHRRHQAETLRDHVYNRIATWFDDLLRISSRTKGLRCSSFTWSTIPTLVHEFLPFFQTGIRYRTKTGEVRLRNHDDLQPLRTRSREYQVRETLPSKYGANTVGSTAVDGHGAPRKVLDEESGVLVENPEFAWPQTDPMRVVQKTREPRRRLDELKPPSSVGAKERERWWKDLELQLLL
jgi:hypothetical protein